jgi:SAM-dependent methyltransferase
MPVALTDDVRAILQAHFKDIPPNEHPEGWNKLYEQDFVPWDRGKPNPALSEILARKDLLGEPLTVNPGLGRKRKKALVPGCGLGYDVLVLASFGYDAYGLEYSSLALKGAKETEEKKGSEEYYKVKDEHVGEGSVNWLSGDFFKDEWCKQMGDDFDGGFDLIYDYTVRPPYRGPDTCADIK